MTQAHPSQMMSHGCRLKRLPPYQLVQAADVAVSINPVNAVKLAAEVPLSPQHIALLTQKYWSNKGVKLGVKFLDTQSAALKNKILSHMNAWGQAGKSNVVFYESATGEVRIAFAPDGYWSYLGTDILLIPPTKPTMNLQDFGNAPDSEFYRVVRHETGHTLGFPHEHMRREIVDRIDPSKAYAYFLKWDGWDKQTVDEQVLTPLEDKSLLKTPVDVTSIMCYDLPAEITRDGVAIPGGADIDKSDASFCVEIYPGTGTVSPPPPPGSGVGLDLKEDFPAGNFLALFGSFPNYKIVHGTLDQTLKFGKHTVT